MSRQTGTEAGKSVRLLRVGEEMRHLLAAVLARGGLKNDVIDRHIISVTEVRCSPDLKHATVFVRALGTADHQPLIKALAENAGALRAEVARGLSMKYTPQLRFRMDESFDAAGRIDAVLRRPEIARDLDPPCAQRGEGDHAQRGGGGLPGSSAAEPDDAA